jgi:hypothetical protein
MSDPRPTNDEEAPPPSTDDWGLDDSEDLDPEVVEKLPPPPV